MISEGFSYPAPDVVLADLGEKVVGAFSVGVQRTKTDLATYRQVFPQWVADHSERGLANWIHDRLWVHLLALGEGISTMQLIEKGMTREIVVGLNYRLRVKRHTEQDGAVSSYPTLAFLDFMEQPRGQFPLLAETRLFAGYEWSRGDRSVGSAVISLWDGRENLIWQEILPAVEDGDTGAQVITPDQPGPASPTVVVPANIGTPRESTEEA